MSAVGQMFACQQMANGIAGMDNLDPVAKLAVLEALCIVSDKLVPFVDEFNRDSAEKWEHHIRQMADDLRKSIPKDAWSAAVLHSYTSGPSKERMADFAVLFG